MDQETREALAKITDSITALTQLVETKFAEVFPRLDAIEGRLRRLEDSFAVLAADVYGLRADIARLEKRIDNLEPKPQP
jgi:predicted nuclease with TOPRIM domain